MLTELMTIVFLKRLFSTYEMPEDVPDDLELGRRWNRIRPLDNDDDQEMSNWNVVSESLEKQQLEIVVMYMTYKSRKIVLSCLVNSNTEGFYHKIYVCFNSNETFDVSMVNYVATETKVKIKRPY